MYGLPVDFDLSIFVGRSLQLVSFTVNTVHLAFNEDLSITIESSYAHQLETHHPETRTEVSARESTLMRLLGKVIESAEAFDIGTLVLHFEGGQLLKCFDDSSQYEAYKITNQGKETIV